MSLSAIYAVNNFLKLDSSEKYIQAMSKFYPKALDKLSSMKQKSEMIEIYKKLNVKEIDIDEEISLKNIKSEDVNDLVKKYKSLLLSSNVFL